MIVATSLSDINPFSWVVFQVFREAGRKLSLKFAPKGEKIVVLPAVLGPGHAKCYLAFLDAALPRQRLLLCIRYGVLGHCVVGC